MHWNSDSPSRGWREVITADLSFYSLFVRFWLLSSRSTTGWWVEWLSHVRIAIVFLWGCICVGQVFVAIAQMKHFHSSCLVCTWICTILRRFEGSAIWLGLVRFGSIGLSKPDLPANQDDLCGNPAHFCRILPKTKYIWGQPGHRNRNWTDLDENRLNRIPTDSVSARVNYGIVKRKLLCMGEQS